jgi:IS5 family transposase
MAILIRATDTAMNGAKGYASDQKRRAAENAEVLWAGVGRGTARSRSDQPPACSQSSVREVRAKVQRVFRVLRCQFGYRKMRSRGIARSGAQVCNLLALASLYSARGRRAPA